jgi:hypothetical protein
MKKFVTLILSLAIAGSAFAQMSGYSSQSNGTTLGANETLTADGIALGNAVKLRGYVNTILHRQDDDQAESPYDGTIVNGDIDLLIDLSPVTAEIHLRLGDEFDRPTVPHTSLTRPLSPQPNSNDAELEQIFSRYSFNQDFHLTFGRQLTVLGFESDEATDRYAVTNSYRGDANMNQGKGYVDGIRLNYNNGMFGFILGLHDSYNIHTDDGNDLEDGMAIDIAASVMLASTLELRLGFANENGGSGANSDDARRVNGWVAWKPNDLTLALELDHFDLANDHDGWDMMLLANYQFTDMFAATLRYAHMDEEDGADHDQTDRITLALLFNITDHFDINFEYSHVDEDDGDNDNEFYLQALLAY